MSCCELLCNFQEHDPTTWMHFFDAEGDRITVAWTSIPRIGDSVLLEADDLVITGIVTAVQYRDVTGIRASPVILIAVHEFSLSRVSITASESSRYRYELTVRDASLQGTSADATPQTEKEITR